MNLPIKMKRHWILILPLFAILFSACPYYITEPVQAETSYTPIFMTRASLESSVASTDPQKLLEPGKMVVFNNYIFLNEKFKGIHVIDNSNPQSPQKVSFIRIPGCIDLAVKNNLLYADNAVDLVAINISNVTQVSVAYRSKDAFPELTPPDLGYLPSLYTPENRKEGLIIVGWKK